MIDEVFANSGELSRGVFDPFYGQYVERKIRDKIVVSTDGTPTSDAEIEFSIYDSDNALLEWRRLDSFGIEQGSYELDTNRHIAESSVPNGGNYALRYNFFKPTLGSPEGRENMYVQSFSDDRREIRVRPNPGSTASFRSSLQSLFSEPIGDPLQQVGNFGRNRYYRILSWSIIAETGQDGDVLLDQNFDPQLTESAIIRFENELPQFIEVGDELWIGEEMSRPYFDKFEIFRAVEPTPTNELAPPDFTVDTGRDTTGESRFETLDDITEEGSTTEEFIEAAFGQGSADLNVDYTDFDNFVHFSSAEERLKNFRFKLRQLESFIEELKDDGTAAGRKETVRRQAESLIGSFDSYEAWLFRTKNVPEAYPKSDDGSLASLDVTTKQGNFPEGLENPEGWFPKILQQARRFDDQNLSALRKQVPEFVREDPDNQKFVLFVDLIGQWFDQNWIFIDQFENFSEITESAFRPDSLSADLSRVVAESMGLETFNGFDAEEFFDRLFDSDKLEQVFDGADISENEGIELDGSKLDLTRFQAQQQVWRRLLSNLVHQYKTRGTENSIRMLANIFGVPTGSLVVREYGGAVANNGDQQAEIIETTHNLSFFSSQNLAIPWNTGAPSLAPSGFGDLFESFDQFPKGIELRFRSEYQGGQPLQLFELQNVAEIRIDPVGVEESDEATIKAELRLADGNRIEVETDPLPIFNGRWTNLLFQLREGEPFIDLFIQQRSPTGEIVGVRGASFQIGLQTASNFLSASNVRIGGALGASQFGQGVSFIGDLDQVNLWRKELSEKRFDIHTLAPTKEAVDNSVLAEADNAFDETEDFLRRQLLFRLDFPTSQNLAEDALIENESEAFGGAATATGFADEDEKPWQFNRYERTSLFPSVQVGATSFFTNKIRIEQNSLDSPLQPDESVEDRPQELITKDSNKLGIFFSPYTSANRDILSELGIRNINGLLGNPRDQIDGRYDSINAVNRMYWDKYDRPVNKQQYIRYIDEFYDAFFEHIRDSVPARAVLIDGIVIEPTILERDRQPLPIGEVDQETLSATIDVGPDVTATIN